MRTLALMGLTGALALTGCLFDSDPYDVAEDDDEGAGGQTSNSPGPSSGNGGSGPSSGAGSNSSASVGGSGGAGGSQGGAGGEGGGESIEITVNVGPQLDRAVPDGAYDGSITSMACVNVPVPLEGTGIVDEVTVEVGIDHTWLGDLTLKLVSPDATVVTLVSLPGVAEPADDGESDSDEASDLDATAPIRFAHGETESAEDMGGILAGDDIVCLDDSVCDFAPNAGAAVAGELDDLAGEAASGTWQLCVGDSFGDDAGFIQNVKLVVLQ